MADVFICYSTRDQAFVRRLYEGLAKHNREGWIDWKAIRPPAEWWKEICAAIEHTDNFLFVVSPDSCASELCREEVASD